MEKSFSIVITKQTLARDAEEALQIVMEALKTSIAYAHVEVFDLEKGEMVLEDEI